MVYADRQYIEYNLLDSYILLIGIRPKTLVFSYKKEDNSSKLERVSSFSNLIDQL